MFEFAISRNQQRRPSRRFFVSSTVSCLAHICFLLLLIQYPQLLRGGMYHRFHALSALTNLFGSQADDDDKNWRTVTVLRSPMMEPSAATIKKYLHPDDGKGSGSAPVKIRWGDEERAALENARRMARLEQDSKAQVVLPPPSEANAAGNQAQAGRSEDSSAASSVVQIDAGKKGTANIPPAAPPPKTDIASNIAPTAIPNGIKPPPPVSQPPKDNVRVFDNEQKALRSPDSGFFDTKGFPLGDYIHLITERIKGKWFIPSNLRNYQGHTTIIFYIGKDGRFTDARIEPATSSDNASLNLAALKAILDSSPFPPLPKGFPGDRVGAKFVLSYNEP
jgi:TonB family protein